MNHRLGVPPLRVKDLSEAEQALRNAITDATEHNFAPSEVAEIARSLKEYGFKIVGLE